MAREVTVTVDIDGAEVATASGEIDDEEDSSKSMEDHIRSLERLDGVGHAKKALKDEYDIVVNVYDANNLPKFCGGDRFDKTPSGLTVSGVRKRGDHGVVVYFDIEE